MTRPRTRLSGLFAGAILAGAAIMPAAAAATALADPPPTPPITPAGPSPLPLPYPDAPQPPPCPFYFCPKATAAATAASGTYLEIPGVQAPLAVQSFSWGATQAGAAINLNSSKSNRAIPADDFATRGNAAGPTAPAAATNLNSSRSNRVMAQGAGATEKSFVLPHVLERGSLTVQAALPGCAVGAHYPAVKLVTPAARFELRDAIITNCPTAGSGGGGGGSGAAQPTESVSFSYAKVQVRGWDPKKKEE